MGLYYRPLIANRAAKCRKCFLRKRRFPTILWRMVLLLAGKEQNRELSQNRPKSLSDSVDRKYFLVRTAGALARGVKRFRRLANHLFGIDRDKLALVFENAAVDDDRIDIVGLRLLHQQ